ncbi:DNA-binding protein, partial [candidate division WOR-3 bacterium]|nr:DNA-binding protein [candidate division WOR-3 bacterium]
MVIDDLKTHIDDILNVLDDDSEKKVSRKNLETELKKFLEYGVPVDQAKQTLIKKFSGDTTFTSSPSSSERTLIKDLQPNAYSVNLLCRVITINPKEITVKGENKKILYGIIGDESGTIPFTAWNELDVKKGDTIEVSNAYTREWQGTVQLNFGDRVSIEKTDEDKLPDSAFKPKEFKIKELRPGLVAIEVTAQVLELDKRETEVDGTKKKVFSGVIGDETGKAQFTSWHDFKLKKGDVIKISGGYIKSWKGIPQLTFDEKATVKKLDESKLSGEIQTQKIPLHMLVERHGALDIEAEGTVMEIRSGSGLIVRCPECDRVLWNDECKIHGKVEGKSDIRIKLVVDDGTGAVSTIIGRELTEKLLGKT